MDLLGGYGSDDNSNNSSTTSSPDSGDKDTAAPTAPLPGSQPLSPAAAAEEASSRMSSKPAEKSRRGKRLISLHAVLPTHILEQLTKSAATGGALDNDSDEDVEENVVVSSSRLTKDSRRQHATVIVGKDEGLSSFLSELQSAPTTVAFLAKSTRADAKPAPSSQHPLLGQAFTTTQTVVVSQKSKNAEIMNVHATKRTEPAAEVKPFCVSSESENAETGQKPTAAAARLAAPPRPSLAFVSVPRPGMNNRPVISAPLPAAFTTTEQQQQQYWAQSCKPDEEETVNAQQQRLAKKRSRQELERALRAGNLQALEEGATTVVEAEASTYAPREETYRVPNLGGITKVSSVSMYDPKAGTDVMQAGGGATGKQRGKHQINALLASAASLELQRARAAMGTSGSGKGKRADAKRKYGW